MSNRSPRAGLSLLELLLALSLSIVLLGLIGMALNIYYKMFDQRRTSLEESRVARSVLQKVAGDMKSVIQFEPPDLSGLSLVSASVAGLGDASSALGSLQGGNAAGAAAGSGALGNLAGGAGAGNAGAGANATQTNQPNQAQAGAAQNALGQAAGAQAQTGANTQTGATPGAAGGNNQTKSGNQQTTGASGATRAPTGGTSAAGATGNANSGNNAAGQGNAAAGAAPGGPAQPSSQLGLRGSAYELEIDISRLPRIDEYTSLTDPNNPLDVLDIPSDVKTISYFVVGSEQEGMDLGVGVMPSEGTQPMRGLFRRERSRALTSLGVPLEGEISRDNSKLLAQEVTALEFSYFDGAEWYSDWDSSSMGGLPRAVEIAIQVDMSSGEKASASSLASGSDTASEAEPTIYRLVVALPSDPLLQLPEYTPETTEDPAATGGTNTAGGQAAPGVGAAGLGGGAPGQAGALGGGGMGAGPGGQGGGGKNGQGRGGQGGANGQGGFGGPGGGGQGFGGQQGFGGGQGGQGGAQGQGGQGGRGGGRGGMGRGGGASGQGGGGRGGGMGRGAGGGVGGFGGGGQGGLGGGAGGFGGGAGGGVGGGAGGFGGLGVPR